MVKLVYIGLFPAVLLGLAVYIQLNASPQQIEVVPSVMNALRLHRPSPDGTALGELQVDVVSVPPLPPGHVLIKVAAAPINPSDVYRMMGSYGSDEERDALVYPTFLGFEGSGTVVATGGGFLPNLLIGSRVAFAARDGGSYAEYFVGKFDEVVPLPDDVTFEEGASAIVNPLTVIGILDMVERGEHRALIHTAAASSLGKMLLAMCKEREVPLLNVVRRESQRDLLLSLGADPRDVFVSTSGTFLSSLRGRALEVDATIAFDAIAGSSPETLMQAMPDGGEVFVYGTLSGKAVEEIAPWHLLTERKILRGFHLKPWLDTQSILNKVLHFMSVRNLLSSTLRTVYAKEVDLHGVESAVRHYMSAATGNKVIVKL